jgi:LuxR family maltose regulon positive regulatory protein
LVSAPAGSGKTTLVASWLSQEPRRDVVWLQLVPADDMVLRFVRALVAAIQRLHPNACPAVTTMLRVAPDVDIDDLVYVLHRDLDDLPDFVTVVLDDYHVIRNSDIHNVISRVGLTASRLGIVIISRVDPPISLARLRADGRLVEIRATDLRFTRAEAEEFLRCSVGRELSGGVVALLHERTEGWAAGLRLAALSLRGGADPEPFAGEFAGSARGVAEFLAEEVFARLPPDTLDFLLKTSILSRFNASLCDALIQQQGSAADVIGGLERDNLFLVPLDSRREWYRYHHLFRDVLRRRLLNTFSAEIITALQRRAAIWFAREGLIDEAVPHYLAVGDAATAADLVELHVHSSLERGDWRVLATWLDAVPAELLQARPRLLLACAWVLQVEGQVPRTAPLLNAAERLLDDESNSMSDAERLAVRGEIDALRSSLWRRGGNTSEALACAQRACDRIPQEHAFARGFGELARSEALRATGDPQRAMVTLQHALADRAARPPARARILFALVMPGLAAADLNEAERRARQLLNEAEAHRLPVTTLWGRYFLGYVAHEWWDLNAARGWFESVIAGRDRAHLIALREAVFGLALTLGALGDRVAAHDLVDRELGFADSVPAPQYVVAIRSLRARLALNEGDLATATRWLNTVDLPAQDREAVEVESASVTAARVLLALGTGQALQRAARVLDEAVISGEVQHDRPLVLRALAVRALVWEAEGERDAALRTLQRALLLAAPGRWITPFIELGEPMRQLLAHVPPRDELDEYPAALHAQFTATATPTQARLTERELDVLELLSRRRSNKEIAQALSISVVTVKRHTVSLYGKLSVPGRHQAVARARALGLLGPDAGKPDP